MFHYSLARFAFRRFPERFKFIFRRLDEFICSEVKKKMRNFFS